MQICTCPGKRQFNAVCLVRVECDALEERPVLFKKSGGRGGDDVWESKSAQRW